MYLRYISRYVTWYRCCIKQEHYLGYNRNYYFYLRCIYPIIRIRIITCYLVQYDLRILPTMYDDMNPIFSSILPVIALSMSVIANVARFTRTEMISVLNSEYMTLAKAKGLDRKTLIFKHALRNALIPVITI